MILEHFWSFSKQIAACSDGHRMATRTPQRILRDGRDDRGAHFFDGTGTEATTQPQPSFSGGSAWIEWGTRRIINGTLGLPSENGTEHDALVVGLAATTICIHALRPGRT